MTEAAVTTQRPSYVARDFPGRCKVFPVRDTLLLPYQAEWVLDDRRMKLCEKSRQIGFTWATAYAIVRRMSQKRSKRSQNCWITSRDAEQAALFVHDVVEFGALLDIGARDLGEKAIDEKGTTTQQVRFANGLVAHSMSSNFNAQAGKRGSRVLDEFGLHEQQRALYAIAKPGITWGGQLEIFSTHRGSQTFFNHLVTEARENGNPKRFSLHRVTLQDALDSGFLYKLQTKLPEDDERQEMDEAQYFDLQRQEAADEESFLQEYMCVPSDESTAFISWEMIDRCRYRPDERWEMSLADLAAVTNPLYVGVDVGREHDLTVVWVIEKAGPVALTRAVIRMQKVPFSLQEATLYPILALPNMRRCCIDETGLGRQFAERAGERYGKYRVEGVNFSVAVKEELAYPVRNAMEDANFRIPDDPAVIGGMRAIKKVQTAAGNVRFAADRGKNGHADDFWAAALALHASATASGPVAWEPLAGREDDLSRRARHPVLGAMDDQLRRARSGAALATLAV